MNPLMKHVRQQLANFATASFRDVNLSKLFRIVNTDYPPFIEDALDTGINVNLMDKNGWTALMEASRNGKVNAVKALISYGAKVDAKSNYGETPLYEAALNGYLEVVKILVRNGADINVVAQDGTVLDAARSNGHTKVASYLMRNGAKSYKRLSILNRHEKKQQTQSRKVK